jgi:site-specific DNA-methyltransferase (adenine-specific)
MTNLRIETIKISSLTPDPTNARRHDSRNLESIKGSLKLFGQRKPIVVTGANVIVAGNGTVEAAKDLGWSEILIVRTPIDWTPEQVKAYALADNRTAELAEWDAKILADQLVELDAVGWDVAEFGFDPINPPTNLEDDEPLSFDDVESKVKLGELWQLGDHRLLCGDSTDEKSISYLMNGELADLVLTDPPYRYKPMGDGGAFDKGHKKLKKDLEGLIDFDPINFLFLLSKVFRKGINAYIFCNTDLVPDYCNWAKKNNFNFNILTWHKLSFIPASNNHHYPDTEYLIYISKSATFNSGLNINYGKYFVLNNEKSKDHPTIKPSEILITEMQISSNKDDVVLDFYGGSGSTLIAAEKLKRKCRMIELDPKYCDVIIERWERLTGKTAERLES